MTRKDNDPLMWPYWRDKYGYIVALRDYYPAKAEDNLEISAALAQIKAAERVIDAVMKEAVS